MQNDVVGRGMPLGRAAREPSAHPPRRPPLSGPPRSAVTATRPAVASSRASCGSDPDMASPPRLRQRPKLHLATPPYKVHKASLSPAHGDGAAGGPRAPPPDTRRSASVDAPDRGHTLPCAPPAAGRFGRDGSSGQSRGQGGSSCARVPRRAHRRWAPTTTPRPPAQMRRTIRPWAAFSAIIRSAPVRSPMISTFM